jgi:signal transduction histidine kinase/CheY-like chemotaxis protein
LSSDALDPRRVEEILARLVQEQLRRLGADAGLVLLRTRSESRFIARAPVGVDAGTLVALGELLNTGLGSPAFYVEHGFPHVKSVPLGVDTLSAGELHVLARKPLDASDADLASVGAILGPLAVALRSLEAARVAEERGDVVQEVAGGLLRQLELSALFPDLIRLVARLCPCDAASVAVYRSDIESFELVAVYGPRHESLIRERSVIPVSETPMREAWFSGGIVAVPDARQSPYARARKLAEQGLISTLYIPLGEPRQALLCVGHRLPYRFGEEEIKLFRSFVPYLEIALRNAELVGKIRAAYRDLDTAQDRLVRAERLRALGELAAEVAHDVGNALAIVASHAELLAQRTGDAESRRLVEALLASVHNGSASVKHVLDVATGDVPVARERVGRLDAAKLVREAALLMAPRLKPTHRLELGGVAPVPETPGDPGEVREAILNLLLNAIDATPEGGTIGAATRVEGESVLLAIEDSGAGVPQQLRERIFEPFYTSKGPGHVGLGLAQVARIARQHGGSVRVTQAVLGGARFELRLPVSEPGSGPHELPKPRAIPTPLKTPRSVEILLVEDEPALRGALSALLGLRGYRVVTAGDVDQALVTLEAQPSVQIVITDLGLPGRSGWELVDEIRRRRPGLPIVVLSGVGALSDPERARERGVAAILGKPTSEQDLAATIESLVN